MIEIKNGRFADRRTVSKRESKVLKPAKRGAARHQQRGKIHRSEIIAAQLRGEDVRAGEGRA